METKNYNKSNQITTVALNKFSKAYSKELLSDKARLTDSIKLITYLCEKFKIPNIKRLVVMNKPRKRNGHGTIHGYYVIQKQEIWIYNLTASTNKIISIKCFYDTLLHEFMHHYDYTKLHLGVSLHTSGFYMRISDLKKKITE